MKKKVFVILGQTATGKSDLAVKLAKKLDGEIISADSRQVYRGLDIGTGKITKKEMRNVPHHLLDVASPKRRFTVAEYRKKAIYAIADIFKRGKTPIICGGTGFYIDTITKGTIFPAVPPNPKFRKSTSKLDGRQLLMLLEKLDPGRAKSIDKNNKVRLIRAIEIAKYLDQVPRLVALPPSYEFVKIGLFLPQALLKKKIESRVNKMFKAGLLKEIQKLKKSGVSAKRLRELGFEYYNPTPEKVIAETLKYAKRQMTWFKRDKEIKWFDASENGMLFGRAMRESDPRHRFWRPKLYHLTNRPKLFLCFFVLGLFPAPFAVFF